MSMLQKLCHCLQSSYWLFRGYFTLFQGIVAPGVRILTSTMMTDHTHAYVVISRIIYSVIYGA